MNFDDLNALDDEELLKLVGESSGKFALRTDAIRRGQEIFDNIVNNLQDVICGSDTVKALFTSDKPVSDLEIFGVLTDLLTNYLIGVAPASISILLLRRGMPSFCAVHWGAAET